MWAPELHINTENRQKNSQMAIHSNKQFNMYWISPGNTFHNMDEGEQPLLSTGISLWRTWKPAQHLLPLVFALCCMQFYEVVCSIVALSRPDVNFRPFDIFFEVVTWPQGKQVRYILEMCWWSVLYWIAVATAVLILSFSIFKEKQHSETC